MYVCLDCNASTETGTIQDENPETPDTPDENVESVFVAFLQESKGCGIMYTGAIVGMPSVNALTEVQRQRDENSEEIVLVSLFGRFPNGWKIREPGTDVEDIGKSN